jgi:hypothetical protein
MDYVLSDDKTSGMVKMLVVQERGQWQAAVKIIINFVVQ